MKSCGYFLVAALLFLGLLQGTLARAETVTLAGSDGVTFERYPAAGQELLLWMASEHGLSEAELDAARKLARQGTEVWQWDVVDSYFLSALPGSLDQVPTEDVVHWLMQAIETGKRVRILTIARAARPLLRALAALSAGARSQLCVALLYPNLYANAEPLDEPAYLDLGRLDKSRVLILQPKKSAATPWLPALMQKMMDAGIDLQAHMLDSVREGFWEREDATPIEMDAGKRLDELLWHEFQTWGCGK